jgi:hypothetical protein
MSDITGMTVGCPITPENSGGPLLCREIDGSLCAIGIMNQQAATKISGLAVNFTADWKNAKAALSKNTRTLATKPYAFASVKNIAFRFGLAIRTKVTIGHERSLLPFLIWS